MRIRKTNVITREQNDEILNLQRICFEEEDLENAPFLSNEINFNRSIPCFYMLYEGNELIAFLTTFMPMCNEAEICAFTHPEYRNKGYFKRLLKCAQETLKKVKINNILFVVESKSKSGLKVMEAMECRNIDHSEYRMSCLSENCIKDNSCLKFVKVDNENKDIFVAITRDGFVGIDENNGFVDSVISSKEREAYIAYDGENPIGCFNFNYEGNTAFLYGVAVLKKYRGMGFGKIVVNYAEKIGLKKYPKVILEVDSGNDIAFNLYKKCGFSIEYQVDYYKYEF